MNKFLAVLTGALAVAGTAFSAVAAPPMGGMAGMGDMSGMPGMAMPMKPRTHTTALGFSASTGLVPVGRPSVWTLRVRDIRTGKPVNDFEVDMTKLMHLIVVKTDLSWFNHIHPIYQGRGVFIITATVPLAGTYRLYADFTRQSQGQEVPTYSFRTAGAKTAAALPLKADPIKDGWLRGVFAAHAEGEPDGKAFGAYRVALMPMPLPLVAGHETMLHFQLRDAAGRPLTDLQPYLGAMGHCVILSADGKLYLHSHPIGGDASGPNVMFHTEFPRAGTYKIWGQFRHRGHIVTSSFVVAVK